MLRSLFITAALIFFGSANATENTLSPDTSVAGDVRSSLLGEWCGEEVHDNGTSLKWLVNRFSDGTYRINFTKVGPTGKRKSWGELGVWGIRYPIYFTAVRGLTKNSQPIPAELENPSLYDAYEVLSITGEAFSYKSYASGNTFTVRRSCASGARL